MTGTISSNNRRPLRFRTLKTKLNTGGSATLEKSAITLPSARRHSGVVGRVVDSGGGAESWDRKEMGEVATPNATS